MSTSGTGEALPPRSPLPLPGPVWLYQTWRDLVFIHWPVEPASVRGLFPNGTRPDTLGGRTYVGIVGLSIPSSRLAGLLELGSMHELNVRLYSIDRQGRQGVVFLSMDVSRLGIVLAAHALFRLPYVWSDIELIRPEPAVGGFTLRRRLRSRLRARVEVEVEAPMSHPSDLEVFLTSRWGLHNRTVMGTTWIPIAHPPFLLHRARLRHADRQLLTAVDVPSPNDAPVGVLWSPGIDVQIGRPAGVPNSKGG